MTPDELRRWREGSGLTQAELAEALGVTKAAVSHWETGRHRITARTEATLRLWAKAHRVRAP